MEKEMLEKIKETFDCALKMSALFFPIVLMQPQEARKMGISLEDILYLNKNYYEINEFLKEEFKKEN